jgi:hypothetical protein
MEKSGCFFIDQIIRLQLADYRKYQITYLYVPHRLENNIPIQSWFELSKVINAI